MLGCAQATASFVIRRRGSPSSIHRSLPFLCKQEVRNYNNNYTNTRSMSSSATIDKDDKIGYVFDPPSVPSVAITGSTTQRFPVHRIYCVGRNYGEHVKEMGGDPKKTSPTFFTKPPDAICPTGTSVKYPLNTTNLHYEVELVIAIGVGQNAGGSDDGSQIPVNDAKDYIFGYGVGIDLTRRDLQSLAKSSGSPWDTAKGFDQSAPISSITPVKDILTISGTTTDQFHEQESKISLEVNGQMKQNATLGQMIWSVPEIVSELSNNFQLQPGDLIFTGTPSGVGPIVQGDRIVGKVDGLEEIQITIH